ncbi:hypothetical protein ABER38_12000, partial [Cutibacterium acnes]
PFTNTKAFLDPAGGGSDESVIIATASVGPYIHVIGMYVYHGGQTEENIKEAVEWCDKHGVLDLTIEDNMGHGTVVNMYRGEIRRQGLVIGCSGVYSSGQKEMRIINRLNAVLERHRLVIHWSVLEEDVRLCRGMANGGREYSLFWQMQNITLDRDSIPHDDRVETLSAAVYLHVEALQQDEHEEQNKRVAAAAREFIENPMGYDDAKWRSHHKQQRGTCRRVR